MGDVSKAKAIRPQDSMAPVVQRRGRLAARCVGNLRAVQPLPGHTKIGSTVRNLGVDTEGALSLSEGIDS